MIEMAWELYVVSLLFYGLAFLGITALSGRGRPRLEIPDGRDAPIFVTRRGSFGTSATVTTRAGRIARIEA